MEGLKDLEIRIGTFTNISRNMLPMLIRRFQTQYPTVRFVMRQGDYTEIQQWIRDGEVDFGFSNSNAVKDLNVHPLYRDWLVAVLPADHRLRNADPVSCRDLREEPFILLDEGDYNLTLEYFDEHGVEPNIAYTAHDDYTIMEMVREKLGISFLYRRTVTGYEQGLAIRPLEDWPENNVSVVWKDISTMPRAARTFMEYITDYFGTERNMRRGRRTR